MVPREDPRPSKGRLLPSRRKARPVPSSGKARGFLSWRAADLAMITREVLGHHLEACFAARFPREGMREGGPMLGM